MAAFVSHLVTTLLGKDVSKLAYQTSLFTVAVGSWDGFGSPISISGFIFASCGLN